VWKYDRAGRESLERQFVTRFFFKEFLDLPDTCGQNLHQLVVPFENVAEVVGVRPHSTYMAVEWRVKILSDREEVLERIIEAAASVLGKRFGWKELPNLEYLTDQRDLDALRQRVKVPGDGAYAHYRWRIGMG
jgi:hypothetical protein